MQKDISVKNKLKNVIKKASFTAKRDASIETGVETWYNYYAGYSASFSKLIIESVELELGSVIFDPWNGSGTTTYVAEQLGYQGIGIDINPVAVLVANAKLANPEDAANILGFAREIIDRRCGMQLCTSQRIDPLNDWLDETVISDYRFIETNILQLLATGRSHFPLDPRETALPPLASFLLLALMKAARSKAAIKFATNPTWIKPDELKKIGVIALTTLWLQYIESMSDELRFNAREHTSGSIVSLANSRKIPLTDSSINFVLTSPPYCTRIDYPVSTSFELSALGIGKDTNEFDLLRRASMGRSLVEKGKPPEPKKEWPKDVKNVLEKIRKHSSKASSSYYYKTYWDYFDDCYESLNEIFRCLKPNSFAVLVVQGSYYKEIHVDLPSLYKSIAKKIGFKSSIVSEMPTSHALSQINVRSAAYRSLNDMNSESVVLLEKK
jgi:DNA modification methylase